jgi:NhaP-type Na+/H+ or K+/H+ antiporter
MGAADITVLCGLILAWCLLGGLAQRIDITSPMVFVLAGAVLGGPSFLDVSLTTEGVKLVAEITLALLLFNDAARVDLTSLRQDAGLPIRLLAIGLPLTVLAGALAGWLVFPSIGLAEAALIAACLAPTDAGLDGMGVPGSWAGTSLASCRGLPVRFDPDW